MSVRGTHALVGPSARQIWHSIVMLAEYVEHEGFEPYLASTLAHRELFAEQMGDNRMYEFKDRSDRDLVLIPEVTAVIREGWREGHLKAWPRLWYAQRCYRYDKPQRGRYREFWQFGLEELGHTKIDMLALLRQCLERLGVRDYEVRQGVARGLGYYTAEGFEVHKDGLQLAGGGPYAEGQGWALGLERCLLTLEPKEEAPL